MSDKDAHQRLADQVSATLSALNEADMSADLRSSEREANRWLFDRLIDWRGMCRDRPLTQSIEFLTPARDVGTPGWYWNDTGAGRAAASGGVNARKHQPGRNWVGPFSSHKAAQADRDKNKPASRVAFLLEKWTKRPAAERPISASAVHEDGCPMGDPHESEQVCLCQPPYPMEPQMEPQP